MADNIDTIIGEDPSVIFEKAFIHLRQTLSTHNPIAFIAAQFNANSTKSKPKRNKKDI